MASNSESLSSKRRGIQSRLILLLLFVLIPVFLIEAYLYYDRFQSQRAHELQANLEVARAVSKAFEAFVQDVLHQELAVGLAISSSQPMVPHDINRLLGTHTDYAAIRDFSWASPEGVVLYSSNPAMVGANNSDRAYLRGIIDGRDWAVGELVLARTTGKPVFGISRGIRDEKGTLLGVVVATVVPEKLDSVLSVERGQGGALSLMDHKGMLVYRYPALSVTWEERNWLKEYPLIQEILDGKEIATTVYAPYEGKKRLVANTPVRSIGWVAGAGRTEEVALQSATSTLITNSILFLAVTLTAFGIAIAFSCRFSTSVQRLRDHALALGRGELESRAVVSGVSELEDLASVFETMAEKVRLREMVLRENEEWLRVTLSSIGDAVIATDTAARITFVNPVAATLTGWLEEEARGRAIEAVFRIINEKTRKPSEDTVLRVLRDGRVVNLANHTALISRDGREIPIEDSAAPIRTEGGDVRGVVLVFHDVTEKRAALAALRESREDLNRAQAVAQTGSWRMNVQRNELLWSDENHRVFGIPKGAPMTYETFLGTVHPDDRVYVHTGWTAALRGEPYDIEHRIVLGDTVKWVRERAELEFDRDGVLLGGFGTTQDITERKQAEQAVRDSETRFRLLSETAGKLLSADNPQQLVNDLCRQVMVHLDCQTFFNFLVDERAERLHLNACAGIPDEEVRRIEWLDYGVAVCGCAARDAARIVAEDIFHVPDVRTELVKSYGIQAYACHPLMAQGRVIGTLSFGTKTRTCFSPQDLDLMKTVADQVAVAMERRRLVVELEEARDELETRVRDRTSRLAMAMQSLESEIAEREDAERILRESERLLRMVLETLPVGVWITDQTGRIVMANPAAEQIWAGARYVGLEHYGEYKGWWADTGEPIAAEEWALARAITRGESSINEIVDIQCFDGTRKTILNSGFPIRNEHDEIIRAIVVNQDITELRQVETELRNSEKRLRSNIELFQKIVDGITDPLIMLDRDGLVTMINKAAMGYYGVAQATDCFGKPCFLGLRGRETACPGCDYPFHSADDQTVTFERKGLKDPKKLESVTIYPVHNEFGEREAVIVKTSDVTQAKLLERQILHTEKLASLGLMTSGIAHEINNPNSFIFFNIPILRKYLEELMPILDDYAEHHPEFEVLHMSYGDLREDIFKLLENMEHGSHRINKIVGTLKSFVRKRDKEGLQRVDLRQVIDKVVALCRAEIKRTVKSFEILIPEDFPPLVSDPEALEQVLLNLLINAIHACDKEDSRIALKVGGGTSGTDDLWIEISDNGAGIEDPLKDKIFDPFFTTKPALMGTGLGLYICHHNVESLGGSIEVESTVGEGATFRILFPQTDAM